MIMVHRHQFRAEKEEWKTALEMNMLVKMINVMTGRKRNSTDSNFFAADYSYFEIFDKTFLVSLFQLLLFHCPRKTFFKSEFTVYLQVTIQQGS